MLTPTKDKEAREDIAIILSPYLFYGSTRQQMRGLIGEYQLMQITDKVLAKLERLGYKRE